FNAATGTATEGPASAFGKYDFIIFENSDSQSQVYGRALIGGDLTGQSSDYANGLGGTASGTDVLVVAGNVTGGRRILTMAEMSA
ncbi:collagen-binding domain-containing protein, partial [Escherichia coli]|uniref:collagen-binding domain-containing protein n=2 Tax=Pseudomonadota TaxID=1224 RepID=UPI0019648BE6